MSQILMKHRSRLCTCLLALFVVVPISSASDGNLPALFGFGFGVNYSNLFGLDVNAEDHQSVNAFGYGLGAHFEKPYNTRNSLYTGLTMNSYSSKLKNQAGEYAVNPSAMELSFNWLRFNQSHNSSVFWGMSFRKPFYSKDAAKTPWDVLLNIGFKRRTYHPNVNQDYELRYSAGLRNMAKFFPTNEVFLAHNLSLFFHLNS